MQVVILAMMAERKFDLIEATARRSADALRLSPADIAKRLMVAGSLEDVFNEVRNVQSDQGWFSDWRSMFTMPRTAV